MSSYGGRNLTQTPTWAVSGVCAAIIVISIGLEMILHKVGKWLTDRHKNALYEALEKVKAELMILGFISLILVFTQYYISAICIPSKVGFTMLPCDRSYFNTTTCGEERVPLISVGGLHQIHILIFFLAVFHVIFSALTMFLGRLKTRAWKQWENETSSHDYEFSNDPSRFRLSHETSFVRAHTSFWTRIPVFFYIGCFFQQFFRSVTKSDYMTLRNGFIAVHLAPGSKFDFQKYIKRSLEDDFKTVVGVTPVLWASFVVFLLLNVNGSQAIFWASLIPLVIILAVGTKLQTIVTQMALEITERHAVVQGIPLVQGSDKYFWFGRPQLVLNLIHFSLFQNAFQVTYFLWIWYSFGLTSCFHNNFELVIAKICLGALVLFLCSYITLPLYALIAQMGSHMKKSIFDEQTSKALRNWHRAAKKKHGAEKSSRTLGGNASPTSSMGSPFHPTGASESLHRFKTTGHSAHHEDLDGSDIEDPSIPTHVTSTASLVKKTRQDDIIDNTALSHNEHGMRKEDNFSFAKPPPGTEK